MHSRQLSQQSPVISMSVGEQSVVKPALHRPREITMRKLMDRDLVQFGGWDANWDEGISAIEAALECRVPSRVNEAIETGGLLVMRVAHRRIRVCAELGDRRLDALRESIESSLGVVTELGHSRTFLRLQGPEVRYLMSMLMPIDFAEGSFPLHTMAQSNIHHAPSLVVAVRDDQGSPAFDLHLPRTFAESIAEWIIRCGAVPVNAWRE